MTTEHGPERLLSFNNYTANKGIDSASSEAVSDYTEYLAKYHRTVVAVDAATEIGLEFAGAGMDPTLLGMNFIRET